MSLNASLVFEQSYGGVDGDSASAAELFALLSALAEAPIKQSFAVTGSIDQRGQIQAIGGANEKIEGFFDSCRITGFTGRQGVIIPASNVKHLMLRRDVVAAVEEGRFSVYPMDTVDQGLELLTGIPAGVPDAAGNYPAGHALPARRRPARRLRRKGGRVGATRIQHGRPIMSGIIQRVVVPLDAVSESRAAIDTAARLAARAEAPLHGIFVEDEDLLHLASLPFARQTTLGTGAEKLTTESIELSLRAAAERARRDLAAAAKRHGVKSSFEVVRGASASALSAALETDLVVAGGLSRPIGEHFRLECRWWSSIEVTRGPVLLVRHAGSTEGSVAVLLRECSTASARLLAAAAQVAQADDGHLTVICPPAVAGSKGFEAWISEHLAGVPVRLQIEVAPAEPAALRARITELGCRLLAVEAGGAEGSGDRLREFVERFACDVLIGR